MDGEVDGAREEVEAQQGQSVEQAAGEQQQERPQQQAEAQQVSSAGEDYRAQLSARDERIAELEKQVAEASESKAAAKKLTAEIEKVRSEAADERVSYELRLAGVRNVKAAKALLADHEGDVDKLREAEPWLFAKHAAEPSGASGLEPAGAATSEEAALAHWRELAGLADEE